MRDVHSRVGVHVHVLMQRGTLHIQLMNTHAMDSSNSKKHAHRGMHHNRSQIIRIVNTGNLFTTINNQSELVQVNSAVLHLDLDDEMAPKQIVVATLRIGHDLPATSLALEYVELRSYGLLPRSHFRRLQSLAIALRTRHM